MLVDVAFRTLGEQARLVPRRVVGDLLEQRVEHLADAPVAAKSGAARPLRSNIATTSSPEIARSRMLNAGPSASTAATRASNRSLESSRLRQARAVDVRRAQREEPAEMLGPDPPDEAAQRLVLRLGVGGVHVVQHEVRDGVDGVVRQAAGARASAAPSRRRRARAGRTCSRGRPGAAPPSAACRRRARAPQAAA